MRRIEDLEPIWGQTRGSIESATLWDLKGVPEGGLAGWEIGLAVQEAGRARPRSHDGSET